MRSGSINSSSSRDISTSSSSSKISSSSKEKTSSSELRSSSISSSIFSSGESSITIASVSKFVSSDFIFLATLEKSSTKSVGKKGFLIVDVNSSAGCASREQI